MKVMETQTQQTSAGEDHHDEIDLDRRVQEWNAAEEFDDGTGAHLDPKKVVLGKVKELEKLKERQVYS